VESASDKNRRLGVDTEFSEQKHGYVLTFPWNFPEIIQDFEHDFKPLSHGSYWYRLIETNGMEDFHSLFRIFHQCCAIPEFVGLEKHCEPRLANYVKESVSRIHFHGLDLELANLTVRQPKIELLKVEIH